MRFDIYKAYPRAMARMLEPGTGTCGQIDRPPPEPPPEPPPHLHHTWNTFQQTGQTMPKPHEGATPLQRMPAHSEKLEPQLPAQAMRWGSRAGFIQSPREIGHHRAGGAALKYRTHGNHAVTAIVGPAAHPRNAPTETRSSIILSNYNGSLFFGLHKLGKFTRDIDILRRLLTRKIGIFTRDIGDTTAFAYEYTHTHTHTLVHKLGILRLFYPETWRFTRNTFQEKRVTRLVFSHREVGVCRSPITP